MSINETTHFSLRDLMMLSCNITFKNNKIILTIINLKNSNDKKKSM